MATITGLMINTSVPPVGWNCRTDGELLIYLGWLISWVLDYFPRFSDRSYRLQFRYTLLKDCLATAWTMGMVIRTQIGVYNKCSCYSWTGHSGLDLPFMGEVKDLQVKNLTGLYLGLTIFGIVIQLLMVPGIITFRYHSALRVFLQRDDG